MAAGKRQVQAPASHAAAAVLQRLGIINQAKNC